MRTRHLVLAAPGWRLAYLDGDGAIETLPVALWADVQGEPDEPLHVVGMVPFDGGVVDEACVPDVLGYLAPDDDAEAIYGADAEWMRKRRCPAREG